MTLMYNDPVKSRGCFHEIQAPHTKGSGAFLTLPGLTAGTGKNPFFVSNITFGQKEKFHVVQCFNDSNYVYAFGHDPMDSLVEVVFTAFLVNKSGDTFGESLKTLTKAYGDGRLSKKPEYATLTLGTWTVQGLVIGMRSGTEDAEHNLQSFSVTLLLVEAQNG